MKLSTLRRISEQLNNGIYKSLGLDMDTEGTLEERRPVPAKARELVVMVNDGEVTHDIIFDAEGEFRLIDSVTNS